MDNCLGHDPIKCGKCSERCEKGCIDFNMTDEEIQVQGGHHHRGHGAWRSTDPTVLDEYGYTRPPERADQHRAGAADQLRRAHQGPRHAPDRPPDAQVGGLYPVRGLAFPEAGQPLLPPTSACMNTNQEHPSTKRALPGDRPQGLLYRTSVLSARALRTCFRRSRGEGVALCPGHPRRHQGRPRDQGPDPHRGETRPTNELERHRAEMGCLGPRACIRPSR